MLNLWALPLLAQEGNKVSGAWTKKGYEVAATWTLARSATSLSLSADFATRKAPDLKIFLVPRSAAEVTNRNVVEGAVLISPLASPKGAQSYRIPDAVDLDQYQAVVIHCQQYSKLWAAADLE